MKPFSKGAQPIKRLARTILVLAILAALVTAVGGGILYWRHQRDLEREASARHQEFVHLAAEGAALIGQRKFAQAASTLEQALSLAPGDPDHLDSRTLLASDDLATAYSALGRLDDAERAVRKALEQAANLRETQLARPEYSRAKSRLSTTLANMLLAKGKLADAELIYQRVVSLNPRDAAAQNNLANALYLEGKLAQANPHYDIAAALAPDNPEIFGAWGRMLLEAHQPGQAEEKFKAAIGLNPKGAAYHYGLGRVYRAESRFALALQAEAAAIDCDHKFIYAFLETADIYAQLGDYRHSETYLRAALAIDHNNLQATVALARLLTDTDDPQQRNLLDSAILYRQAVDLTHGQDLSLLTQLAGTYAKAKYFEQAQEAITQAIGRAREQGVSAVDMEQLLQYQQQYGLAQCPPPPPHTSPLGDVELAGMGPKNTDPYDDPPPTPARLPPIKLINP